MSRFYGSLCSIHYAIGIQVICIPCQWSLVIVTEICWFNHQARSHRLR